MNKKDVLKLKPGTFVEVLWLDSPPEVGMLVERTKDRPGDVAVKMFYPNRSACHVDSHAVHTQINCVLDRISIPSAVSPPEKRFVVKAKLDRCK